MRRYCVLLAVLLASGGIAWHFRFVEAILQNFRDGPYHVSCEKIVGLVELQITVGLGLHLVAPSPWEKTTRWVEDFVSLFRL